eukprot:TRINITY_DN25_c0_g1_i10.p1 TRINITY_DN25_c0_g1~~TRINITY_DN25_c0_g1_i10.p1  ORF type:complete len:105 (+),score=5.05 TRINITY_DN25_c0_g1_i10:2940-3254(+)
MLPPFHECGVDREHNQHTAGSIPATQQHIFYFLLSFGTNPMSAPNRAKSSDLQTVPTIGYNDGLATAQISHLILPSIGKQKLPHSTQETTATVNYRQLSELHGA